MSGIVQLYAAFAQNSLYIDDIRKFDSFVPEICDTSKYAVLECKKPTITLNNVSFGYPNTSVFSLKNINISLNYCEKNALQREIYLKTVETDIHQYDNPDFYNEFILASSNYGAKTLEFISIHRFCLLC